MALGACRRKARSASGTFVPWLAVPTCRPDGTSPEPAMGRLADGVRRALPQPPDRIGETNRRHKETNT
jgi:hypothetical protein